MTAVHIRRDTRRHPRRTTELPVVVRDPAGTSQRAIHFPQVEISAGGAFLATDLLFEPGEHLELELILSAKQSTRVIARVVRVNREAMPVGVGLEFLDPGPEVKALFPEQDG